MSAALPEDMLLLAREVAQVVGVELVEGEKRRDEKRREEKRREEGGRRGEWQGVIRLSLIVVDCHHRLVLVISY